MKRAHGFTLMELVLVLGLFAAMAAVNRRVNSRNGWRLNGQDGIGSGRR